MKRSELRSKFIESFQMLYFSSALCQTLEGSDGLHDGALSLTIAAGSALEFLEDLADDAMEVLEDNYLIKDK